MLLTTTGDASSSTCDRPASLNATQRSNSRGRCSSMVHPPVQSTSVCRRAQLARQLHGMHATRSNRVRYVPYARYGRTRRWEPVSRAWISSAPPLSCNPTTPTRTSAIDTSLSTVDRPRSARSCRRSPCQPAPTPVHTAYGGPRPRAVSVRWSSRPGSCPGRNTANRDGAARSVVSHRSALSMTANPVSSRPATTTRNHARPVCPYDSPSRAGLSPRAYSPGPAVCQLAGTPQRLGGRPKTGRLRSEGQAGSASRPPSAAA